MLNTTNIQAFAKIAAKAASHDIADRATLRDIADHELRAIMEHAAMQRTGILTTTAEAIGIDPTTAKRIYTNITELAEHACSFAVLRDYLEEAKENGEVEALGQEAVMEQARDMVNIMLTSQEMTAFMENFDFLDLPIDITTHQWNEFDGYTDQADPAKYVAQKEAKKLCIEGYRRLSADDALIEEILSR